MMLRFTVMQIREAVAHAMAGHQALHLHRIIVDYDKAPVCFVNAVRRGEFIAHLFDQDEDRLIRTCRSLGVNVILVECRGTPHQHIDLCGKPIARAIAMSKPYEAPDEPEPVPVATLLDFAEPDSEEWSF